MQPLETLLHPFIQVGKRENIMYVCVLFDSRKKVPCVVKNCEEAGIKELILLVELMS